VGPAYEVHLPRRFLIIVTAKPGFSRFLRLCDQLYTVRSVRFFGASIHCSDLHAVGT
jgi:hypothetical protein